MVYVNQGSKALKKESNLFSSLFSFISYLKTTILVKSEEKRENSE